MCCLRPASSCPVPALNALNARGLIGKRAPGGAVLVGLLLLGWSPSPSSGAWRFLVASVARRQEGGASGVGVAQLRPLAANHAAPPQGSRSLVHSLVDLANGF